MNGYDCKYGLTNYSQITQIGRSITLRKPNILNWIFLMILFIRSITRSWHSWCSWLNLRIFSLMIGYDCKCGLTNYSQITQIGRSITLRKPNILNWIFLMILFIHSCAFFVKLESWSFSTYESMNSINQWIDKLYFTMVIYL
jgi:quinol-cytochrome oxidoreductase complex cytochrome b subunit